jgi:uncharacterized repeat protein (TIGR01451 family)
MPYRRSLQSFFVCLLWFVGVCPCARAAELETTLSASRVTGSGADEKFTDAAVAAPGDTIRYVATFTNTADKPLREVTAALPIPQNLELQPASVKPAASEGSTDGKTFVPLARLLKPKTEGGLGVAPASIRVLRWAPRDIAAATSFTVEARAKIVSSSAIRR